MSWFWTVMLLSIAFTKTSECKHQHKPSAVVVGTVYCDTCFPRATHFFIPGASVAVECKDPRSGRRFQHEVKTDRHGEFKVELPFRVGKHVRKMRGCSVRLISSSKPYCAVAAAAAASSTLHLNSTRDGTHVFSAGFFTFTPQVCDQKPTIKRSDLRLSQVSTPNDPAFLPPVQDPPSIGSFLPPLPRLPQLPQLPRLPPLPGIPFLPPLPTNQPNKLPKLLQSVTNQPPDNLPLNNPEPFHPPPSIIPPITSIFPPLFSAPPLFNLPPLPGLVISPPPSPVQLPPFPFQPTPGLPREPTAEVSSSSETSSP